MSYRRGANFERRVKRKLESEGWFVIRSAGSQGPVDLVALKPFKVMLIQCRRSGFLSAAEREKLRSLAERLQTPVFVASSTNGKITLERVW